MAKRKHSLTSQSGRGSTGRPRKEREADRPDGMTIREFRDLPTPAKQTGAARRRKQAVDPFPERSHPAWGGFVEFAFRERCHPSLTQDEKAFHQHGLLLWKAYLAGTRKI